MKKSTATIKQYFNISGLGWRCGFCKNINTVDRFTTESIEAGKTILSTCKFCEDIIKLKMK